MNRAPGSTINFGAFRLDQEQGQLWWGSRASHCNLNPWQSCSI